MARADAMRSFLFLYGVWCKIGGLEGAGTEQKQHTVRASAIHATIVVGPRARDAVERKLAKSGTERCDAPREMKMEMENASNGQGRSY